MCGIGSGRLQHPGSEIDGEVERLLLAAINSSSAPINVEALTSTVPDHRLRAAIAYLREHVGEPIAVEDVANRVGLSRGQFFALFRDQLNTTPQVFWSAVRVEEAVRRLAQQEEPLTSVALDLGFSTPGNFRGQGAAEMRSKRPLLKLATVCNGWED